MKDDIISRAVRELEDKITKESKEAKEKEEFELSLYKNIYPKINPGMVVKGVVVDYSKDGVLVSVGTKQEGIIPLNELSLKEFKHPSEVVKIGEEVNVIVLTIDDNGNSQFSKKRADLKEILDRLQNTFKEDRFIEGKVTSQVKGGLIVDFEGVSGFIPQSHIQKKKAVRNLEKYVGKTLTLKIIEFNRKKRDIILSLKKAEEDKKKEKIEKIMASLTPGKLVSGKVVSLTNFGAFVDIGGIDALIPISELSYRRIDHPKEVLQKGDKVSAVIINVDYENNKVSLSLKNAKPSPWENLKDKISVGSVLKGKVTKVGPSYSFVKIDEEIEGFLPHSELGEKKELKVGQEVEIRVVKLDIKRQKLKLSLKATKENNEIERFLAKEDKWKGMKLGDVLSQKDVWR